MGGRSGGRGTREGANPENGAKEGSPGATAANDVIGVAFLLRGVLGPQGPAWGRWEEMWEATPTPTPGAPSSSLTLL